MARLLPVLCVALLLSGCVFDGFRLPDDFIPAEEGATEPLADRASFRLPARKAGERPVLMRFRLIAPGRYAWELIQSQGESVRLQPMLARFTPLAKNWHLMHWRDVANGSQGADLVRFEPGAMQVARLSGQAEAIARHARANGFEVPGKPGEGGVRLDRLDARQLRALSLALIEGSGFAPLEVERIEVVDVVPKAFETAAYGSLRSELVKITAKEFPMLAEPGMLLAYVRRLHAGGLEGMADLLARLDEASQGTPGITPRSSRREGRHFLVVTGPAPQTADILLFGSAACGPCALEDRKLAELRAARPDLSIRYVPVSWGYPLAESLAETLDAEAPGTDGHWRAMLRNRLKSLPGGPQGEAGRALRDDREAVRAFFIAGGAAPAVVDRLLGSFALRARLDQANALTRRYDIRSVPAYVVSGRYLVPARIPDGNGLIANPADEFEVAVELRFAEEALAALRAWRKDWSPAGLPGEAMAAYVLRRTELGPWPTSAAPLAERVRSGAGERFASVFRSAQPATSTVTDRRVRWLESADERSFFLCRQLGIAPCASLLIESDVNDADGTRRRIHYQMMFANGRWQVVDASFDGAGLLVTERTAFASQVSARSGPAPTPLTGCPPGLAPRIVCFEYPTPPELAPAQSAPQEFLYFQTNACPPCKRWSQRVLQWGSAELPKSAIFRNHWLEPARWGADRSVRAFRIDGIPSLVVNRRFRLDLRSDDPDDLERMLSLAQRLAALPRPSALRGAPRPTAAPGRS